MNTQNYQNHRQMVPLFHYVTSASILALLVGSISNLRLNWETDALYSASLLVLVSFILLSLYIFTRRFSLRAQDRAIRAEESLRHYVLTGKLPNPRLKLSQLIALRFASDEEYLGLVNRAVAENMTSDEIKKAIQDWRPDFHRV